MKRWVVRQTLLERMPRSGMLMSEVRVVNSFVTNPLKTALLNPEFKALYSFER